MVSTRVLNDQNTSYIQHVMDAFYREERLQHAKDGKTALSALGVVFDEVHDLAEWGELVLASESLAKSVPTKPKLPKYAYHVALAFQFLVLAIHFQRGQVEYSEAGLSITHFPKEKQKHAKESVDLVLGDLSLVLMHNLVVSMPASAKEILKYEKVFALLTKDVFSRSLLEPGINLHPILRTLAQDLGNNLKK